jgi:hypothetical protein
MQSCWPPLTDGGDLLPHEIEIGKPVEFRIVGNSGRAIAKLARR